MKVTFLPELLESYKEQRHSSFIKMRRVYGRDWFRFSQVNDAHWRCIKRKTQKAKGKAKKNDNPDSVTF